MINQDEDMKMSFRYIFALNCCRGLLDHKLFLNIIALNWSECARSLIIFLWTILSSVYWFIIWLSLSPSWFKHCLFSFSEVHCIAPQECRGELMSFLSGICKLGRCFSCLKIFLILESNLTFQRSCLFKSDCWNEIREMSIFESIFGNRALLVKDPTHAIQYSPLIVLYFERKEIDSL
jgi:hypothetical protein